MGKEQSRQLRLADFCMTHTKACAEGDMDSLFGQTALDCQHFLVENGHSAADRQPPRERQGQHCFCGCWRKRLDTLSGAA